MKESLHGKTEIKVEKFFNNLLPTWFVNKYIKRFWLGSLGDTLVKDPPYGSALTTMSLKVCIHHLSFQKWDAFRQFLTH